MPSNKRNILYIRCSDGRSRRPEELREHCVHQIREPGGILSPAFYAQHLELDISVYTDTLMFKIETMVGLKKPDTIIVASHTDCGAGGAMGLSPDQIIQEHHNWGERLKAKFPHIRVQVLHEEHSDCGDHHHGHIKVAELV